jgi:hypothetical protein
MSKNALGYIVGHFFTNSSGHTETVSGTDVVILKIFSPKKSEKKLAFLTQNTASLCKK